jgi:hypothetical protein
MRWTHAQDHLSNVSAKGVRVPVALIQSYMDHALCTRGRSKEVPSSADIACVPWSRAACEVMVERRPKLS